MMLRVKGRALDRVMQFNLFAVDYSTASKCFVIRNVLRTQTKVELTPHDLMELGRELIHVASHEPTLNDHKR